MEVPPGPREVHRGASRPGSSPVVVRNIAFTLLSVAIVIGMLRYMQAVLLPLVLAGLLFYALDPFVDRLERLRVPRLIGAALMLVLAVGACGTLAYSLQGQAMTVIDELPRGARQLAQVLRKPGATPAAVARVQQAAEELARAETPKPPPRGVLRVQVEDKALDTSDVLWAGSLTLASAANQAVMVLFLTYFMLLSDQLFKRKLVEIVGSLSEKKRTITVLEDIAAAIERFLIIQIVTSGVVAVATWGALWGLGLEQAALWGLLAGIFNSIPYYGPVLVTAGLAAVAFLQFGTVSMTVTVAGVALLITTLEGFLLTPTLVGRAAAMNKVAVFVGLLFWSWVWGIWGMLLAVPMMMVVNVVCMHVDVLQPVAHLLGDEGVDRRTAAA